MRFKKLLAASSISFLLCNQALAADLDKFKPIDIKTINGLKLLNDTRLIAIKDYPKWFDLFPQGKVTLEVLKENKEALLVELGKTESYYKIYQLDSDVKATLLSSFLGAKGKKYVVQSDFIQYTDKEIDGERKRLGYLIRIQADISSVEANIDLNGLFALGVAAKAKQVNGSLSVQVYGLSGIRIADMVGQQFALTEESLMKAIEGVAVLWQRIYVVVMLRVHGGCGCATCCGGAPGGDCRSRSRPV